jgi:20S proteasome alpha/beta subunit
MTCIAWDGRVLAADKRATSYGHGSTVTKIRKAATGELLAVCGDFDTGQALMAWYQAGALPESFPENRDASEQFRARLLVIDAGPRIRVFDCTPHAMTIEDKCYAMGSGRDYALAAMHLGRNSRKAVEVACALDLGCGNGIDTLRLES